MAQTDGEVIITNDGATILHKMRVEQPAAKMLVELSKSQDVVAGDGTTSVVVLCGSLLKKSLELLEKGVHPTIVSDAFNMAAEKACEVRPIVSIKASYWFGENCLLHEHTIPLNVLPPAPLPPLINSNAHSLLSLLFTSI